MFIRTIIVENEQSFHSIAEVIQDSLVIFRGGCRASGLKRFFASFTWNGIHILQEEYVRVCKEGIRIEQEQIEISYVVQERESSKLF